MRLEQYIDEEEDEQINMLTSWVYQDQFYNFPGLSELFDKDVYIDIKTNTTKKFVTSFFVGDDKWTFEAKKINDGLWSIGFYSKFGPDMFSSKGGKSYKGEVFAGVFRSIKRLLENQKIESIIFNTGDSKLKSLYNKMIPWVEKRFPEFEFKNKSTHGNLTQFLYTRKS